MADQVDYRLKRIQDRIAGMNSSMASTGVVIRVITLITPPNHAPACTVEFATDQKVLATKTYSFVNIMSDDFVKYTRTIVDVYLKARWLEIQKEYNELHKTLGQEKAYKTVKANHPEFDDAFRQYYTDNMMRSNYAGDIMGGN